MSHQTGIQANDELKAFFGKCKDGRVRVIKIAIENEQLMLDESHEPRGSWEEDYERLVPKLVEDKQPCYLFYRLDSQDSTGYDWIFISWSPDNSPVREKMLYASTKATLKKEFGSGQIKHDLFCSNRDDISLRGYHKHIKSVKAPAPLTKSEEELKEIKKNEVGVDIGVDTKHQSMHGIEFPISRAALKALQELKNQEIDYVQLSIDVEKEEINLESKDKLSVSKLKHKVPTDHPRYHLFNFPHTFEGDFLQSIVFIYSVPGYNCTVKERMLYSSCKNTFLDAVERMGINVVKRIETDDPAELTEEFLFDEIHPKQNVHKQKFAKPKGPSNRGARRLIKTPNSDGENH